MLSSRILFILLFSTTTAVADFQFYRGVRQMGMGGASIAVVNDETAVLSNPNGLGRLRDYFFTIADPEITSSTSATETLIGTAGFGSVVPEDVYNDLGDQIGDPYHFKAQMFPSIVLPNFGMGLLGRYEVLARRNQDGTYDYNFQNDYSLNLAYNMRFWGGRIKLGFAGRLINRVEHFGVRDPSTESLAISAMASEGMGVAVDTGLTLAAPWDWLPTFTVYVRDVGNTAFTMGSGVFGNNANGTPNTVEQSIDAAFAIFPITGKHSRATFTVEYTGIDDTPSVDDHMDRLHIGLEGNFWDAYFIRAGYHENDWTAGFEYATGLFQFQMATYSEELRFLNSTDRDRRGIIKFAFRF